MKTIFDKSTRDELISRINKLDESSPIQWGKMNVYQMLKHCTLWEEMSHGRKKYKRAFIGRLFGKVALKKLLKNEDPMSRNAPTIPELRVTGTGDVAAEKMKWVALLEEYEYFSNTDFVHPFFGKITKEQTGYLSYKHTDHHLRQFGN